MLGIIYYIAIVTPTHYDLHYDVTSPATFLPLTTLAQQPRRPNAALLGPDGVNLLCQ
jgi:hypothetical protein